MSVPATVNSFYVTQGNGQVFLQWDLEAGATSYSVQRSTDGITFVTIASPTPNLYLDNTVSLSVQYYYQVAGINASGTGLYTTPQTIVPTPSGEMCLSQIRLAAQQRADKVNSNFVTLPEWNSYVNQAMFELYDLLITAYEDYLVAAPASFTTNGSTYLYPLPNGSNTFLDDNGSVFTPQAFYKLVGVDLALQSANQAFVTINKFNFIDRNRYVYPNTASSIYGVFNMQYRVMDNHIQFIPTPSANQKIRLWYAPRLQQLLQETDTTTIGISGWIEYVIVRAAIYALMKEESDTSGLERQLLFVKNRIEESAINRDIGQPDKISDVRSNNGYGFGGSGSGFNGPSGGW